jgi:hypothetical protein
MGPLIGSEVRIHPRRPQINITPTIIEAMDHEQLWRRWFRDTETWSSWRAFLSTLFGLSLNTTQLEIYRQCTGRSTPPPQGSNEAWLVVGRRGGKSMILALIAVYLAVFRDWRQYLSPGERGTIKVLAVDRRQARVIHQYAGALLREVPVLAPLVVRDDAETIELTNGIVLEIATASFRSIRGFTVVAALLDEIAFWRNEESANPDQEILDAVRPSMATIPGAMLLAASSPYARRGVLYQAYRQHYAKDDAPALVWHAPTRTMNPTVPQQIIDEATERDPASAAAEYQAEFRTDIEAFVTREVIDAATIPGRFELPPAKTIDYHAFVDPSGGSGDSMTLAIAHEGERGQAIVDAIREVKPPFSPASVVAEFATLLALYHITQVTGDRYGGEWPAERFREHYITYIPSEKTKSDLYRELLPLLNSGKVELLDHPKLTTQLTSLERRTGRGTGRDVIDHPPGQHDDLANSVAGAIVMAIVSITDWEMMARAAIARREQAAVAQQPLNNLGEVFAARQQQQREQQQTQAKIIRQFDADFRAKHEADIRKQLLRGVKGSRQNLWGQGIN